MSDNSVLQCLLKNKQMSFQDIFPECSKNRNVARKRLNALIEEGLISQDQNRRRGQKSIISLTPKGEIKCLGNEIEKIEKSLDYINTIFEILQKTGFEEFRERLRELHPTIHVSGPYGGDFPVDKDTKFNKKQITDALRNLEEAFVYFHVTLNTFTGGSDSQLSP